MTALVSRFALRGRSTPSADYQALLISAVKPARRTPRQGGTTRWTGTSEAVEKPARFAA